MEYAQRIRTLPPYLFAGIDAAKNRLKERGVDIISLGIGDPDMPTPSFIIKALQQAVMCEEYHQYPSYTGMRAFKEAVTQWYKRRFNVVLNPDTEVLTLAGSKEGIAHFPFAFVNEGDHVIVCPPNYPVYATTSRFAGAVVYEAPLLEENDYLPDLDAIPATIWEKTKIIFINYPNNPTSAMAPDSFYKDLIARCAKYDVCIVHDLAYSEIYYDAAMKPRSILEFEGAKERVIEFHSLSKTYNMTGWRIGMAVGSTFLLDGLAKIKENVDSGTFHAIQEAAAVALGEEGDVFAEELRALYAKRRDVVVRTLTSMGIDFLFPNATFYVWGKVPNGYDSASYVTQVLEKTGVVLTPGSGFGSAGEGYFRISLTVPEQRLEEALHRLQQL